jgi:arylsulfatase A-like enzyme
LRSWWHGEKAISFQVKVRQHRDVSSARPNIIVVTTDQQRTDSLSCYGSGFTETPHLDALGAAGVICERAYTTNPVCTPARFSLFTGLQVSRHGAWNIGMNAPEETRTIADRLAEVGYRTHNIGKMHFQAFGSRPDQSHEAMSAWAPGQDYSGPYYGFQTVEFALGHATYGLRGHYGTWVRSQVSEDDFARYASAERLSPVSFGGEAHDWDLPVRLHNSVWTADRAIEFLRKQEGKEPFFLALGFQDPHHPHCLPRDFKARVRTEEVPLPVFAEGELADKPPHFEIARRGGLETSAFRGEYPIAGQGDGGDYRTVPPEDARLGKAYYYGMVRLIDEQMGRVLRCLNEAGLAENTLVIFTSDHGELLGDHGLWMKGPFHYEQILRIPLLMRWPAGFSGGQRLTAIVSHLDLVPTILSSAGAAGDARLDGRDALPLLRGETEGIRDGAMIECVDDPHKLRLKTYVTLDRKLTWYHGHAFGELYDLALDPREKVNRWDDPAYAEDKHRLLGRIMEKLEPLEKRAVRDCYA